MKLNIQSLSFLGAVVGIVLGVAAIPRLSDIAKICAELFVTLLKLLSLPLVFFSVVSALGGIDDLGHLKNLTSKILKYTISSTFISASVALAIYLVVDPAKNATLSGLGQPGGISSDIAQKASEQGSYWKFLYQSIPGDILSPFLNNNVLGVLFLAVFFSIALILLPNDSRKACSLFFSHGFALLIKMASLVMLMMPIAVSAFIILFIEDLRSGLDATSLLLYIGCIVGANLFQAGVVLPSLLVYKRIKPLELLRAMAPALTVAFFSKSSAATLPMSIRCAKEVPIEPKLASFSFSLCSSINMNACAAFILITVMFNSAMYGVEFNWASSIGWVFMATVAAVGNAAVPMGCYFLASSFLASQNIPLNIMGIILPVYALLDMLETAINVWSDACVTATVNQDIYGPSSAKKTA